jgi:hypothetical protein
VDVMYFADYWLGGELQVDTQESNLLGGESMPMGSFASMQSVNLTQLSAVDSQAVGGEESMVLDGNLPALYLTCSNSNPDPNEEITVYIHSEEPLFCMDIGVSVIGDADITGAMSTADCNDFGWDPTWDSDPYYSFDGIHIIGVKWESDVAGVVGYLKLQYHGGEISVAINPEDSVAFNGDCVLVPLSDETLTIGHE